MTDREKLIELAHDYFKSVPWYADIADLNPEELIDHLLTNGVRLESEQATSDENKRWIPVSERLPETTGKYLVTGRSFRDRIPKIWICECISVGLTIGWCNNAKNPIVEAWMPLPEPPKEE